MALLESLSLFGPFLGDAAELLKKDGTAGKNYVQPALKNLGTVCIPIVREVISPASFRNEEAEITEITTYGVRRVRAVANKFKFGERRRGLQVLRAMGAGGAMALNRTEFQPNERVSKGYDLNTLVFGDSANRGKFVLPVKAAAQYSDAISITTYAEAVDQTFHNRASEDGTLWDEVDKKNSNNLFNRHFIVPGTCLLQVLTLNGRTMPPEGLLHLLTCIGLAGSYGGQTSVYGVNVRNRVVGIYAAKMERPVASPYEAVAALGNEGHKIAAQGADALVKAFGDVYSAAYPTAIDATVCQQIIDGLIAAVETGDAALKASYVATHKAVGAFFDEWFGVPGAKPAKGSELAESN